MDSRLIEAAMSGNVETLKQLEEEDPYLLLGVTPQVQNTALHIAARLDNSTFASEISERCPQLLATQNMKGDTPLHCAARSGHLNIASHLIQRAAETCPELLSKPNNHGDTPLHEAVRNGHTQVVKALLKVDPHLSNSVNIDGESPLYVAANSKSFDMTMVVMDCNPAALGGPGHRTALHAAVIQKHKEILKVLLEKWPELNKQQDGFGSTAIHYAASSGTLAIVELLLAKDASVGYIVDKDGLSPVHVAARMGYVEVMKKVIQFCPDSGDLIDRRGKNALHVAIESGKRSVVEHVLKARELGELINQPDNDGNTPLHLATAKADVSIVRLLVEDGRVNKGALNKENYTALDIVNFGNYPQVVLRREETRRILCQAGATWGPLRSDIIENKDRKAHRDRKVKRIKDHSQNVALVAILIATVTFAAAFTMPGGYTSNGRDEGQATLVKRVGFKAFIISDTIAMCSSAIVAFIYMWDWSVFDDDDYLYHYFWFAVAVMRAAFGGMIVAFITGVYIVVATECVWLAVLICVIVCCVPFLIRFIVFLPRYHLNCRTHGAMSAIIKLLVYDIATESDIQDL